MQSAAQPTCFLIADISGYTGYLADVELDHAQDILADLVGTVVTALRPNFRLAKLEGDAAFTFMTAEKIDGSMLLDTIERCYFGFRRRRRDVRQATSCDCNACARIPDLDLKFVVHHGSAVHHKVAGRQELVGPDVIVVHRLLKNDVVETAGINAYAKSIAVELGRSGVRANVVCPGSIRTAAWDHRLAKDPEILGRLKRLYPLGRIVNASEVAEAVAFLASDRASGITGAIVPVDAGLTAGYLPFIDDILGTFP